MNNDPKDMRKLLNILTESLNEQDSQTKQATDMIDNLMHDLMTNYRYKDEDTGEVDEAGVDDIAQAWDILPGEFYNAIESGNKEAMFIKQHVDSEALNKAMYFAVRDYFDGHEDNNTGESEYAAEYDNRYDDEDDEDDYDNEQEVDPTQILNWKVEWTTTDGLKQSRALSDASMNRLRDYYIPIYKRENDILDGTITWRPTNL